MYITDVRNTRVQGKLGPYVDTFTVSLLFWYQGLIPDLATLRDRAPSKAGRIIYGVLAMGELRNPDRSDPGTTPGVRTMLTIAIVLLAIFAVFYTFVSDQGLAASIAKNAGHALVTAYAAKRPDGEWSLMVINKDLRMRMK